MNSLRSFTNLNQAYFAQSLLHAAGIEATVLGGEIPLPMGGISAPYQLTVAEADEERALTLIREIDAPSVVAAVSNRESCREAPASYKSNIRQRLIAMVLVDQILRVGLYIYHNSFDTELPADIHRYLLSLAASPEMWRLGFFMYMIAWSTSVLGAIYLLLSSKIGRGLYLAGFVMEVSFLWVFPGGIDYGVAASVGCIRLALTGAILSLCYFAPALENKKSEANKTPPPTPEKRPPSNHDQLPGAADL